MSKSDEDEKEAIGEDEVHREWLLRRLRELTTQRGGRNPCDETLRARGARPSRHGALPKEELFAVFSQIPTPIAVLRGPSHVCEFVNAEACELWSRKAEDIVGKPLFEVLPELAREGFHAILDEVMRSGVPLVGKEVRMAVCGGAESNPRIAHFNLTWSPLRLDGDAAWGIVCLGVDVTDEVEARNRVELLRVEAESENRAKDRFLAMLGHELRTPLAPMLTTLELMRLRGAPAKELDILERQVRYLTRLVEDLLDVSRVARGKLELRRRPLELADSIAQALELSAPAIQEREHRLELNVPSHGLPVLVDPDRMAQVVSNLLTNAAKYSDVGSTIRITAERDGSVVRLRVRDHGAGIAPELLASVFDEFVQQPRTRELSTGGLGLGLTIVRSLVELHGGTVQAYSEGVGRGAEFVVELPCEEHVEPERKTPRSPELCVRVNPARRMRVLVVDDNPDALDTMKDALELLGYTVEAAPDGPTALKTVESFEPEVALLDLDLPVMDGYELARRVREQLGPSSNLHLVAVTGYAQESDRRRSAAAGFERHLVKPVAVRKLEQVVQELGSRRGS